LAALSPALQYFIGLSEYKAVAHAPAIKQAEVGIAVENAVDLAKRAAKMILLEPGLTSIIEILDSGHRVYQRMMTWTITKLSRTAELTIIPNARLFSGRLKTITFKHFNP
jgi:H+-transporting ATPase